jgi:hypothetical protein
MRSASIEDHLIHLGARSQLSVVMDADAFNGKCRCSCNEVVLTDAKFPCALNQLLSKLLTEVLSARRLGRTTSDIWVCKQFCQ